ncbi:MAG: hypothetical protein HQK83_07310, partial [Fibrobacteria bacterium]|nr:hypothetical protein [Fibrobacteria bacterium]
MNSKTIRLTDNATIGIIGGGPAGVFFGHFARKYASENGLKLKILLFESRNFTIPGPKGCNMCAGVISHSLVERLKEENLILDPEKIESDIGGYFFQTGQHGVYLKKP